jgi:NAD kinase
MAKKELNRFSRIQRAFGYGQGQPKGCLSEVLKENLTKTIDRLYEYQKETGINLTRQYNYNQYGEEGKSLETWLEEVNLELDKALGNPVDNTTDNKEETKQVKQRKHETVIWVKKSTYRKIQGLAEKYGQRVSVFTNGSLEWLSEVADDHIEEIFQKIIGMGRK